MLACEILCWNPGPPDAALAEHLRGQDWHVVQAGDATAVRRELTARPLPVGLLWLRDVSAVQFSAVQACLQGLRGQCNTLWVGVLPAQALDMACWRELVLNHLLDHDTQPLAFDRLDQMLAGALRRALLRGREDLQSPAGDSLGMTGHSEAIRQLRQHIRKVAPTDAPVLISGESGSGKELTAQAIHQVSRRAGGPFVAVNCGAIAPALIQSELFGHERGSFTGAVAGRAGLIEAAAGGTLFLDEIADLPLELQTNLLRFLQEHTIHKVGSSRSQPVDVRVIAASHTDLAGAVAKGRFREDLFYRLSVLPVRVPPLRERLTDVPALAQHFFRASLAGSPLAHAEGFSQAALMALMSHPWPGNVRELHNRVRRAVVMADQRLISPQDLGLVAPAPLDALALETVRTLAERDAIAQTLGRVDSNVTHAARLLGISRMTLYRLMDKHGLSRSTGSLPLDAAA
jgi:DNA-binding NtrC family response regulator